MATYSDFVPARLSSLLDDRRFWPLVPLVAFLFVFMVIPMLYIVYISLREFDPTWIIGDAYTVDNYLRIVTDDYHLGVIRYTLRLAVMVTVITVLLGYPLGYFIARTSPFFRQLFLFIIFLPLMVGTVARTYGWIAIMGREGIINDLWQALFDSQFVLLNTTNGVIIGLSGVLIPFVVLPVYSAIESIPRSMEMAARNLGANRFQAFFHVTFRLSFNGLLTGAIFVFALSMSAIVSPNLLGGRGDTTLGSLMHEVATADLNWPRGAALAIFLMTVTMLLIIIPLRMISDPTEGIES